MGSFYDISKAPLLTGAEELELSRVIQAGMAADASPLQKRMAKQAKDRMISSNVRLACNVAAKYHGRCRHLDIEDLAQEAIFGLYRAAELFDPKRGYKFSTYAYAWIKQSIHRAINNQDTCIRVPIHVHDQMSRFRTFAAANPCLSRQEVAAVSETSLRFIEMGARACGVASLNKLLSCSDNSHLELMDLQAAEFVGEGNLMAEMGIEAGELANFIDHHLDEREAMIMRLHYGLDGTEPMTLAAIGKKLGISRERARQLRERATRRVRQAFQRSAS
jgi:RNA polymerase primary sigma factor